MERALTIRAVAAVVLLVASPASASSTRAPTLKSLAAQVKVAAEAGHDAEEDAAAGRRA